MKASRRAASEIFGNPILVGTLTILIVGIAVYLSYIAENGLPFVPTYTVNVDVPNAAELVKNADVRIGGARVGQVLTINPEPASRRWPHPFARLGLSLERSLEPLQADSRFQVRLASVLGGKYLEILPGHAASGGVPDGGTLAVNHNVPFVDLDTAFGTFGPRTKRGLRGALAELADVFAGRGAQLNDSVYSLRQLLGPLSSLMRLFAAPSTRLSEFISGGAATTSALAAVAPTINSLLADTATTFAALERSTLGQTLDQLPPTEAVATTVLRNSLPALSETAAIVQQLRPAAALLPLSAQRLDLIITSSIPVWKRVPKVSRELERALSVVDALARDPASVQTFKVLGSNDLATLGSSAFMGLGAILRAIAPAQFACNVAGLWARNFGSSLSEGDATGAWLRIDPVFDQNQGSQSGTPAGDLHLNYYPTENAAGCQAGNEAYSGTQLIGNPPRTSTEVDNTTPPPGVLGRGRKAGLVP
jgi:virulence factor Mce-like protein